MKSWVKRLIATIAGAAPAILLLAFTDMNKGWTVALTAAGVALAHVILTFVEDSIPSESSSSTATRSSAAASTTPKPAAASEATGTTSPSPEVKQ